MSGKPDIRQRLNHILSATGRINQFTEGMDFESFLENEMAQYAVIKNFEIIGEAAYQLPKLFKQSFPQIEWRKMEAFRHILVHDYYRINMEIVWRAKENRLGELQIMIADILANIDKNR